jgi:Flp pilus assembly secretin CpaC
MTRTVAALAALCLLPALRLAAQEAPPAEAAPAKTTPPAEAPRIRRDRLVPLRVQVTIARFEGEKKTSSLPFTLLVNAGQGGRTSLRMGIEVPVRVGPSPPDRDGKGSYNYKNVGTSIDCHADALDDGRFNLDVRTEQSSVGTTADKLAAVAADLPFFRTFNTSFNALLRDGQTATHVAATDPVSGESVRIEVGITVVR